MFSKLLSLYHFCNIILWCNYHQNRWYTVILKNLCFHLPLDNILRNPFPWKCWKTHCAYHTGVVPRTGHKGQSLVTGDSKKDSCRTRPWTIPCQPVRAASETGGRDPFPKNTSTSERRTQHFCSDIFWERMAATAGGEMETRGRWCCWTLPWKNSKGDKPPEGWWCLGKPHWSWNTPMVVDILNKAIKTWKVKRTHLSCLLMQPSYGLLICTY